MFNCGRVWRKSAFNDVSENGRLTTIKTFIIFFPKLDFDFSTAHMEIMVEFENYSGPVLRSTGRFSQNKEIYYL